MKTKAKSVNVFEVRLWSMEHFNEKTTKRINVFTGQIIDAKTKKQSFFDNSAEFLTILRKMYMQNEVNAKKLKGGKKK